MTDVAARPTSAELRTTLLEAADQLREQRTKPADQRSDKYAQEVKNGILAVQCLDAELQAIVADERAKVEDARAAAEATRPTGGPSAATGNYAGQEQRTAGQEFTENETWATWVKESRGKGSSPSVEVRTLITSSQTDTPSAGLFMPRGTPFIGNVDRRRLFIRNLLPTGNTTLSSVPYIREVSPRSLETGATSVAEGTPKPEVTMQFVEADAIARKLAAWIPVTYEILQDAPTLRSYIDARMAYMLAVGEENQVLNGTGNGSDLLGLTVVTGHQTQAAISGDRTATIGMAISKIENVDLEADGLAINPVDFWSMLTSRFANRFDGAGVAVDQSKSIPFGMPPESVWGLGAVRTRAMASGTALVGAFQLGAMLLDREGITMRSSDSHDVFFVSNKIALLVEERVALPIFRPDAFVVTTLA